MRKPGLLWLARHLRRGPVHDRDGGHVAFPDALLPACAAVARFPLRRALRLFSPTALCWIFPYAVATADAIAAVLAADFVSRRLHNVGCGVRDATNGVGDLIWSTLAGILWTAVSAPAAFLAAAAIMLCGTVLMTRIPRSAPER